MGDSTGFQRPAIIEPRPPIAISGSNPEQERIRAELRRVRASSSDITQRIAQGDGRLNKTRSQLRWLSVYDPYLRAAHSVRAIADRLIGFRLGMVMAYAVLIIGAAVFVAAAAGFATAAFACAAMAVFSLTVLHFVPSDVALARELPLVATKIGQLRAARGSLETELTRLRTEEIALASHEASLMVKEQQADTHWLLQQRREMLAASHWKELRSHEFEQFLKQVFELLGASAELTKTTGDQGADLVVTAGSTRWAVQVKGYVNSVSNQAVQEVIAARIFYGCNACMVITNSVFTQSAIDLAAKASCVLISERELPHLIRGHINIGCVVP